MQKLYIIFVKTIENLQKLMQVTVGPSTLTQDAARICVIKHMKPKKNGDILSILEEHPGVAPGILKCPVINDPKKILPHNLTN